MRRALRSESADNLVPRSDVEAARHERDEWRGLVREQRESNERADDECMLLKSRIARLELLGTQREIRLYWKQRRRITQLEKAMADILRMRSMASMRDAAREALSQPALLPEVDS